MAGSRMGIDHVHGGAVKCQHRAQGSGTDRRSKYFSADKRDIEIHEPEIKKKFILIQRTKNLLYKNKKYVFNTNELSYKSKN